MSLLRYALRARAARGAGGSAAAADAELRTLLRRRDALLAQLRRRGVDFGDADGDGPAGPEQRTPSTSVERSPRQVPGAPLDLVAEVEQLKRGMVTRTVIGQAQGILIERHRVTADTAYAMWVKASQTSNRKLRDIAADLVATGELAGLRDSATSSRQ